VLTLINSNRMMPPIAPVGLDYVAGAARGAGIDVEVLDLCLAENPEAAIAAHFAESQPELVGISFRNVDDCFWPGGAWFMPELQQMVDAVRRACDAPIVLGGVGYSVFPNEILRRTGAEFGIRGDGEDAVVQLLRELRGRRRFDCIEGLIWRQDGVLRSNRPAWPKELTIPTSRDAVDNPIYFRRGGQLGVETKRGCNRQCIYCADPLAKGTTSRLREPAEVAEELEALLAQGVDVFHLCDSEFNIPGSHARDVCEQLIRRGLAERVRWYAYLAVLPFDTDLARSMRRAGCVGINFTSDAAHPELLATYRQPHRKEDLARAVRLCRENDMAVMLDLLLGGPGENPKTLAHSIDFFKSIDPDCVGAALGVRLFPGTAATSLVMAEGPMDVNPGVYRRYQGPIDLLKPTFYVSPALGENPAELVRNLIAGDARFFEPADDVVRPAGTDPFADYNYNENQALVDAIAAGKRGAYWDILRQLRRT
jgi:radical SAM superfamily enzyme YgiQ (UPF0313 family)